MTPAVALLLLAVLSPAVALNPADDPPNLHELECEIHKLAFSFGTSRVPAAAAALRDALNLDNCSGSLPEAGDGVHFGSFVPHQPAAAVGSTFYVSPEGSDSAPGTQAAPFGSLARAQAAARGAATKPATVYLTSGKHFVNDTLVLTSEDSGTTWAASGAAAVHGIRYTYTLLLLSAPLVSERFDVL